MQAATILIIVLSHQGYWFGGQDQSVSVIWPVDQKLPAVDVHWELMLGKVKISDGQLHLPGGQGESSITIKLPPVRARLEMNWKYSLFQTDGGKELGSGQCAVHVFPPLSLAQMASRLRGTKLYVIDRPDGLPALLAAAKIDATRVAATEDLQSPKADLVLVAANRLDDSPFAQAPLLSQAQAGAQVMIFRQTKPKSLLGYPLARRTLPPQLTWRQDHPLLQCLDADDLASWFVDESNELNAIRLPADEPVLELAAWPRETAGTDPVPIDALALVKAVGKGRIVLWQIPLGDWKSDPRSQIVLQNALNYMLTPPEPTPRPSERATTAPTSVVSPFPVPTISIPSGDHP